MVYYNKSIFTKLKITPPKTWDEMMSDAAKIKSAGLIPFALGNSEGWPGLIWEEMLVDRLGGSSVVQSLLAGSTSVWKNSAVVEANSMIQTVVKDGYFQPGYSGIDYSNGEPNALMYSGKAAMQVMLSFGYQQIQAAEPSFISSNELGWFSFPTVPGEKGNVNDEEGNVGQYVAISTAAPSAQKKVAEEFITTELGSGKYAQLMLKDDEAPLSTVASKYLSSANAFTRYTYALVEKAPYYGNSWDNSLPPADTTPLLANLESVFTDSETPAKFSSATYAMAKSAAASG
jgi:raffinose/stachyose/melibiose transport system substrate-binding protein